MTVRELIDELSEFDQDLEVTITDGFAGLCYRGDFDITEFDSGDELVIDIGIGGCEEE